MEGMFEGRYVLVGRFNPRCAGSLYEVDGMWYLFVAAECKEDRTTIRRLHSILKHFANVPRGPWEVIGAVRQIRERWLLDFLPFELHRVYRMMFYDGNRGTNYFLLTMPVR